MISNVYRVSVKGTGGGANPSRGADDGMEWFWATLDLAEPWSGVARTARL